MYTWVSFVKSLFIYIQVSFETLFAREQRQISQTRPYQFRETYLNEDGRAKNTRQKKKSYVSTFLGAKAFGKYVCSTGDECHISVPNIC